MKTRKFQRALGVAVATAFLALLAAKGLAQDSTSTTAGPQLTPNVAAIVNLAQAKVSDDTIIAYINNSGNSYGLDAAQIIYLHQRGISDAVITAMLNQPKPGIAAATVSMPTTSVPQPAVTYVETEPTTYYYYEPYYYPVYSGYYWPYPVVVSYGWSGYRHIGAWHGGSWHGGGVVRTGGFVHSGGFARGGGGVVHGGGFAHGGGGVVRGGGGVAHGGGGGHAGGRH
jgi:hypothetical protein